MLDARIPVMIVPQNSHGPSNQSVSGQYKLYSGNSDMPRVYGPVSHLGMTITSIFQQ